MTWTHPDGFIASDDRDRLDLDAVHGYLSRSYWSPGVPREACRTPRRSCCAWCAS